MKQITINGKFTDYYATEDGHVYSGKTNKTISERMSNQGYMLINLSIDGICKTYSVHRLIAITFIPNPFNLPEINHKNGKKTDNRIENLEWVDTSRNIKHAYQNNLIHPARGKDTKYGRFDESDVITIRKLYKDGKSQYKLAKIYNVTRSAIQQIVNNKTYVYVEE